MKQRIAAVAGIGLLGAVGVALPGVAGGNKYASTTATRACGEGDAVNFVGPIKLWPPNHKFVAEQITAQGNDASEQVSLALVINVTDAVGGDGGANHDPDYTPEDPAASGNGSATVPFNLRAERSGKGDGRTYTIDWTATFDNGTETCSSSSDSEDELTPFVVTVPHDMRGGADWK